MATYHVCDICGDTMPKDEEKQCFVCIGAKKTFRQIDPDYDGLPHVDIECCPKCAKRLASSIDVMKNKKNKPMLERGA